jgi:hypothetical protein
MVFFIFFSGCNLIISFIGGNEGHRLVIEPRNTYVPVGGTLHYSLTRVDVSKKESTDISYNAGWSSGNPDIAVIDPGGYTQTYTTGITTITADYNGESVSTQLFVYEDIPGSSPSVGLIAEYNFDNNCLDSSGNNFDATGYFITYSTDRYGNPGGAAYFNGADSYVETPILWDYPVSFTISAWINVNTFTTENIIIGNCSDTKSWNGFWAGFSYDYHLFSHNGDVIYDYSGFTTGEWYHVAYVYDNYYQTLTLYTNGSYYIEVPMVYTNYSGVWHNYIGAKGSVTTASYLFSGSIDDVMIFDRALSSTEVSDIYNSQVPLM